MLAVSVVIKIEFVIQFEVFLWYKNKIISIQKYVLMEQLLSTVKKKKHLKVYALRSEQNYMNHCVLIFFTIFGIKKNINEIESLCI